jgi:hypothetical protein
MIGRLPNADRAVINPRKLRDYALNPDHPTGGYKAAFFGQMGYSSRDWQQLEQDVRAQHLTHPARPGKSSPHGTKYIITAPLQGPYGPARQVTTVWIIRYESDVPELVTIEPAGRKKG